MTRKEDRFIFMLAQARHALMTHLDRTLLKAADITGPQASVIFFLTQKNGCLLSQLGQGLMLDRSAITGMVDRMEKKELVQRENSATDRRAIHVYLTKKGAATADRILPIVQAYNQAIIEGFNHSEVEGFKRILQNIISKFGEKADADSAPLS